MLNHNFRQLTDLVNYINIHVSHIFHREVGSDWCFDDYCNNFNRMYIVTKGSGVLFNDTEHIVMKPYNIYIIPANHIYSCRCEDYIEKFFLHFTATIIPQKDLLSGVNRIITIPASADEIGKISEILYAENVTSALLLRNYLCRLILDMIEPDIGAMEKDIAVYRKYERLYKYIDDNLYADLTVGEVCSYIGFSQTYIGQKFKSDTGSTIKHYIQDAIVEKLKYYLLTTTLSIGEIAKDLHFDSESYCSKFFKKHTGMAPSEYRKRHNTAEYLDY